MVEWVTEGQGQHEVKLAGMGGRLQEVESEEGKVYDWARKGYIDETAMLAQLDQVKAERADLRRQIEHVRDAAKQATEVIEAAEWVRELWPQLGRIQGFTDEETGEHREPSADEWRELITEVAEKIWVERDGSLTLEGPVSPTSLASISTTSS